MTTHHDDLRGQLEASRHGEAAGWLAFSPGPAWFPLALGAWSAGFVLALGYLDDQPRGFAMLGLTLAPLAWIRWQTRRQGAWPSSFDGPPGFGASTAVFVVGAAIIVCAGAGAVLLLPAWVAAVLVALVTAAWAHAYSRAYARDAAEVRAGLEDDQ